MITRTPLSQRRPAAGARTRTAATLVCMALLAGCPFDSDDDTPRQPGDPPSESTFSKSYGGPGEDTATAVVASADGGFLLVGQANAASELNADGTGGVRGDLWINKLDGDGNVVTQRLIGLLPATSEVGTTRYALARPLPDGGALLVGTRWVFESRDAGEPHDRADIAVARVDAQNQVVWTRTHDSGAWLNYDYFATSDAAASAHDTGTDIWPMPDGGYLVAGVSRANLEDRFGIGFPCPLLGDEAGEDPCQSFPPGTSGNRFLDAISVVAMRVAADGEVRWIRRLTEEAFRIESRELPASSSRPDPVIRATHDGGALVGRTLRYKTLFHRLLADGSPLPLTVVDQQLNITAIEQTDDPGPGGARDGVRNDGFIVSAKHVSASRVIKLAGDGALEWNEQVGSTDIFSPGPFVRLHDVHQRCNSGGASCVFAAVGTYKESGEREHTAYIVFLDDDGDTIRGARGVERWVLERIQGGVDGAHYRMLGRNADGDNIFAQLISDGSELRDDGPAPGLAQQIDPSRRDQFEQGELTPEGGALFFRGHDEQRLMRIDVRGSVASDTSLVGVGFAGESAVTAVEISPGRYVIAAQTAHTIEIGLARGWLLRYDIGASGDSIAWQRSLTWRGDIGFVEALAASGDGGFVAGVQHDTNLRLAKFGADARLLWQTAPLALPETNTRYRWREILPTADGGFVAVANQPDSMTTLLYSVDGTGTERWQRHYRALLSSIAPAGDGGFLLVGQAFDAGNLLRAVRVDAAGELQWSRVYSPGGRFHLSAGAPRVRRAADGFIVGMTDWALLTRQAGDEELPRGAKNVVLLSLDGTGQVRWTRIYGALLDEHLSDLAVRADGVILAAGDSDSLGDNREAWLMKLGPDGQIASGCNAHLADFPVELIAVSDVAIETREFPVFNDADEDMEMEVPALPLRTATDLVTARQCSGTANPPGETSPPAQRFRLTVSRSGDRSGGVTSTPSGIACGTGLGDAFCAAEFVAGTRVTLRADIENFTRWITACEDGTGGTSLQCLVTVDRNRTVEVLFGQLPDGPRELTVQVTGTGSGNVTAQGIACPGDCTESYANGTVVALRAVPNAGSFFQGWAGGCDLIDGDTCTVTMNAPRTVNPVFQLISGREFTLAVAKNGDGAGTVTSQPVGIVCGTDCSESYAENTSVTLTAAAQQGSSFAGWFGCQQVDGNECTVTMGQAREVTATFDLNPNFADLTVVRAGDGAGVARVVSDFQGIDCGDTCTARFLIGSQVVLTPAAGSPSLQGWQGCDSVSGAECRVTIGGTRTVTATFNAPGFFAVTVLKTGAGSGTVTSQPAGISCGNDCVGSYAGGTTVGLFTVPGAGSRVIGYTSCDRVVDQTICEVDVDGPREVTVRLD